MYKALQLNSKVKAALKAEWDGKSSEFSDPDMAEIANDDTDRAIDNSRYTHAVIHEETKEYVALIGIIKATAINCHKVLDIRLSPSSNPDYQDELEIGLLTVSEDIVGAIIALTKNGIFDQGMRQVKIFGRGHEMKRIFNLVEGHSKKVDLPGIRVFNQAGWLVIESENKRS